jgi:hypothetical protein
MKGRVDRLTFTVIGYVFFSHIKAFEGHHIGVARAVVEREDCSYSSHTRWENRDWLPPVNLPDLG